MNKNAMHNEKYVTDVMKCAMVLFGWMVYTALVYLALAVGVPCNNTYDKRNWAAVRWATFYCTHFWYVATVLFWAFCSLDLHTYPVEKEEELKREREKIEKEHAKYVTFFNRIIKTLNDNTKTEGIMYIVLAMAVILTLLTMTVSSTTQLWDTKGAFG
ncbi:hypothetical protein RFI_01465 [Reticulomyxa filosa]|uniref:Uncharacterized protein n=1 Tax=Reticulomyxa filosa TaxID=46433 RepID=X6PBU6_RETFI|nr:hypothetical protein RFI_01465 [Reticulomyxa filosa]|eukprot:ETO35593.1 hypothetical protein RFI_01465 [Reticulomyxa filosa]